MDLEIITRQFKLGEEQREAIGATFEKLERFSPRPVQSVKVTITHEAGRFQADGVLRLSQHDFRAEAESVEPEYAVNELAESLRKQLDRFKGKMSGRQKGEEGGLGRAMLDDGGVFAGEEPTAEGFVLKDMGVEEAKAAFERTELPFLIFRNLANRRLGVIYRSRSGELTHLEAAED
jgi:ribosomal subunit interface protein